eukprot:Awhi_evm1s8810
MPIIIMSIKAAKKCSALGKEEYLKHELGDKNQIPMEVAGKIIMENDSKPTRRPLKSLIQMGKNEIADHFHRNERIFAVSEGKLLLFKVKEEDGGLAGLDGTFSANQGLAFLSLSEVEIVKINDNKFEVYSRHNFAGKFTFKVHADPLNDDLRVWLN